MWDRLEMLAHFGSGLGALAYAHFLFARREPSRLRRHLSRLLQVLGGAMVSKAVCWAIGATDGNVLFQFYLFLFSLFPLFAGLFIEALLGRDLPLIKKLLLLLGTVFLGSTSWLPGLTSTEWWHWALLCYLTATTLGFALILFSAWRRESVGPVRSIIGTILFVAVLSPFFLVTDSAHLLGVSMPRLGSVPLLLLVFYGPRSLHAVGARAMRKSSLTLVAAAVGALAAAATIGFVLNSSAAQVVAVAGALLVAFIAAHPLVVLLSFHRAQRDDLILERLATLPVNSLEACQRAISAWPEVERVVRVVHEPPAESERRALVAYFLLGHAVRERSVVRRELVLARSARELLAVEQTLHLMDDHQVDVLAALGNDQFLGIRFRPGFEEAVYHRVVGVIGLIAGLIAEDAP